MEKNLVCEKLKHILRNLRFGLLFTEILGWWKVVVELKDTEILGPWRRRIQSGARNEAWSLRAFV